MTYGYYNKNDLDEGPATGEEYYPGETSSEVNWPKVVFSMLICIIGLVGNSIVIFIILVLREFRKSVTHWYVLQLAVADSLFLLTLPFKSSEDINKMWIYPDWMCKARESLLFLNYYASVTFLMVMSVDRYVAVCRTFSDRLQKIRKLRLAVSFTILTWFVCLCLCIPSMLLAHKFGDFPACSCSFVFPTSQDQDICKDPPPALSDMCLDLKKQAYCRVLPDNYDSYAIVEGSSNGNKTFPFYVYGSHAKPQVQDFPNGESFGVNINAVPEGPRGSSAGSSALCNYDGAPAEWKWFLGFNFVVMYIFPIAVMVVSYGLIVRKLANTKMRSESITSLKPASGRKRKSSAKSRKDRRRVTIMCASLVATFVLLWLPLHVYHLARIVGIDLPEESSICENLAVAGFLLAYLNSALNPYLYSFLGSNFKKRWERSLTSVRQSIKLQRRGTSSGNFTATYTRKRKVQAGGEGSSTTTGTVVTKVERAKKNRKLSQSKSFSDSTNNHITPGEANKVVTTLQNNAIEVASSNV